MDPSAELLTRVVLLDVCVHFVNATLPLDRGQRAHVVSRRGWRLRHHLPGTDHAGGALPPRVVTRVYRSAFFFHPPLLLVTEPPPARHYPGAAGDHHQRPLPAQFRHRCLCENPVCTLHAVQAINDRNGERRWFIQLVHWLVATRGVRLAWRGDQERPLRRNLRRLTRRALHWTYRGRPADDSSFVRRRADPTEAAAREVTVLDALQRFGTHVCAHPEKLRHVQFLKFLQLYQRRPDDGGVRPRHPGSCGFVLGKLFGGARTCVLRLEQGLELRDGPFLQYAWPVTALSTALQPDGTLPFVCGASLPAVPPSITEPYRQARCSSAPRRRTRR